MEEINVKGKKSQLYYIVEINKIIGGNCMNIKEVTKWNGYKRGEATCYGWKLNRVQVKITDNHYINNFIDHILEDAYMLRDIDKIILFGDNATCIAIYPKCSEDLKDVVIYLESIKNTDIHTIVLSIGNEETIFMDSDMIENMLTELNATTKIDVRFIVNE